MFEEWLEGLEDDGFEWEEDQIFWCREAYRLGLQRGFDSGLDCKLAQEVGEELLNLNEETKS